tara:strand:+ start:7 stop:873 length:867 start_codon:yes stop_codon:yes gene_type:complete
MSSYAFPSGHAAVAYFASTILSKELPHLKNDLEMLSNLIGQSRLENGVHYPTDVLYGRLVGEMLGQYYNDSQLKESKKLTDKDRKNVLIDIAFKLHPNLSKNKAIKNYVSNVAQFLYETSHVENINIDYQVCVESAKQFVFGYPTRLINANKYVINLLNSIQESMQIEEVDSSQKLFQLCKPFSSHDTLLLREGSNLSKFGFVCCENSDVYQNLSDCFKLNDKPVLKNIVYEWINPFEQYSTSIGRVMLLSDLSYNFDITNQVTGYDYISSLRSYVLKENIPKILRNS